MTDEIMYRLMEMSGQEYVDVYAAKVKADLEEANKSGRPAAVAPIKPTGRAARRARRAAKKLARTTAKAARNDPSNTATFEGRGPGTVTRLPGTKAG